MRPHVSFQIQPKDTPKIPGRLRPPSNEAMTWPRETAGNDIDGGLSSTVASEVATVRSRPLLRTKFYALLARYATLGSLLTPLFLKKMIDNMSSKKEKFWL